MYLAISEHFDQTQTSEHDQEEAVVHYIKNMIVAARMPFRDGKRTVGIVRQEVLELRRELGH